MEGKSFSNKLDKTLKLMGLSNVEASKLLNIDPSYISRLRSGTRIPKSESDLVTGIAQTLAETMWNKELIQPMCGLLGDASVCSEKAGFSTAVLTWFRDFDEEKDTHIMATIMDSFSEISIPQPTVNKLAIKAFLLRIPISKKTEYEGLLGLQQAVIRFLVDACRNKNVQLCLYSDQDMEWMTESPAFYETWKRLMALCLINGVKIKIIHYIKRDMEELTKGFASWLPLYFLGEIESYCRFDPCTPPFSHTLFLNKGQVSIEGNVVRGNEKKGRYRFGTSKADLDRGDSSFSLLLEDSRHFFSSVRGIHPLEQLHKSDSTWAFLSQSTLPLGTMDKALLWEILKANRVQKKDSLRILAEFEKEQDILTKVAKSKDISFATFLDDPMNKEQSPMDTRPLSKDIRITYSAEQRARHLAETKNFFDTHGGSFYLVGESLFSQVHIYAAEKIVYIKHMNLPDRVFFCDQLSMVQAAKTILKRATSGISPI